MPELIAQVAPRTGYVNFVCLNPSTADESKNDPTIRRCIGFAKAWGFTAFAMTNLFAWRSTDPKSIRHVAWPAGDPENVSNVINVATGAELVVCAWGVNGAYMERDTFTVDALKAVEVKLHCLRTTDGGFPEHPLYLPKTLTATPFRQ